MKRLHLLAAAAVTLALSSCRSDSNELAQIESKIAAVDSVKPEEKFEYVSEQFADLRVLLYEVKDFEKLPAQTKELLYYLYEAALCGRDITWDQNYKYNLTVRKTLEAILSDVDEHIDQNDPEFKKFMVYAKRVFFSNGIHHHYSSDKIIPECSKGLVSELIHHTDSTKLPIAAGQTAAAFSDFIIDIMFNEKVAPKKVQLDPKQDLVTSSAVNFYEGVNEKEVTAFYEKKNDKNSKTPVMIGLNSKVVKENGQLVEKVWKVGGMYSPAIEKIVYWLSKAVTVAETPAQKVSLEKLIKYYQTGDLKDFDDYCCAWVKDTEAAVDVVNGFIEMYQDPLGRKGSFESVVSVKDFEASKRISTIGENAQWFEDNSPILKQHKKDSVKGISAKVINAVIETGDAGPASAIGINLPNNEWIRSSKEHGSKSVNIGNIVEALDNSGGETVGNEFYYNDEIKERAKKYGALADKLHTDMHEVIGHASGKIEDGVGASHETLKNYASALEEGRADLVALYYLMDQKLIDLGVMPSLDCGKAAYDDYITNGLMLQTNRIKLGDNIQESHMRNRQMVAGWVYEKGQKENVIEKIVKDGKTYFVVNDYNKLRVLFGELLKEIQRVKSQGDYKAGRDLIENYGVKIDPALHKEVLDRYGKLKIASYSGFIQPKLTPVMKDGKIVDVKIEYPTDFLNQMLEYGKNYGLLPAIN